MRDIYQQTCVEISQINNRLDRILKKSSRQKAPEWLKRLHDLNNQIRDMQDNPTSEFQTLVMQDRIVCEYQIIIDEYLEKIKKDQKIWEDWQRIKKLHLIDVDSLIENLQGSLKKQMEKKEIVKQLEQEGKYLVIDLFVSLMRVKEEKPENMQEAMMEEEEKIYEKANEFFRQMHRAMVDGTVNSEWKELIGGDLSQMNDLVKRYPLMKQIIQTENEKLENCFVQILEKSKDHCYPAKKLFSWSNSPAQTVWEMLAEDNIIPALASIVQDSLSRTSISLVIELRSFLDPERQLLSQQLKLYVKNMDAWAEKKKRQCSNQELNEELISLKKLCKNLHHRLNSKINE